MDDIRPRRHHMVLSGNGQAFHQCLMCFKVFEHRDHCRHQKTAHHDTDVVVKKGFQCKKCFRVFNCGKSLKRHCSKTCPTLSPDFAELLTHPNRCGVCQKLLKNEKKYKRHYWNKTPCQILSGLPPSFYPKY